MSVLEQTLRLSKRSYFTRNDDDIVARAAILRSQMHKQQHSGDDDETKSVQLVKPETLEDTPHISLHQLYRASLSDFTNASRSPSRGTSERLRPWRSFLETLYQFLSCRVLVL